MAAADGGGTGVAGVVAGFLQLFAGFTVAGYLVIFTLASLLFTLWVMVVGWRLLTQPG